MGKLQVWVDKVLTAASHDKRAEALTYALEIVLGMVIAEALKPIQALAVEDLLEMAAKSCHQLGDL